jgi:excisionase family DNA binding protein
MKKALPEEKVTIQAAARTLGVSKGTVVHFLNNGKLTRIKEGSAVFVSMDEIETLLETETEPGVITPEVKAAKSEAVSTAESKIDDSGGTTVTVDRAHYEELLTRVGQLEVEKENLLVYKKNMVETKGALSHKEREFQQTKAKLHLMEEELRRLKKMGWWKRVFGRKWKMTGG